jgi:hypothetical protein
LPQRRYAAFKRRRAMLTHRSLSLPMISIIAGECWLFWRLGAGAERLCAAISHVEKTATRTAMQAGVLRGDTLRTPSSALLASLPWREQIVGNYLTEWRRR